MVDEKEVKNALKNALKKKKESNEATLKFDRLAGEYFGINDFSAIYEENDEIVDPIIYGDGNITWKQLCKVVKRYKKELENQQE